MRIVIDMQGAQTQSRFRGIGRYTLAFAQAILRNRGNHEIYLALSGLFPDTIEPICAAFEGLLPKNNICVWYSPGPVAENEPCNRIRRENAELVREAFLESLEPNIIHISSLFEGYLDDAVTSMGRFDSKTLISVTHYDLIPLLNPDQYLSPYPRYSDFYFRKIQWLKQASCYLAISAYAEHEGRQRLRPSIGRFFNVSSAIESKFRPLIISNDEASRIVSKYGIHHSYLLYTGGIDARKNIIRLIDAYASLDKSLRSNHQLLIAGEICPDGIDILKHQASSAGLLPEELIFTGYISDEELIRLYNLCKLFVFPSWHEGFGLPALEAMACGAPVIGANTSSLPEVIGLGEALFDPMNVPEIATKIEQALTDDAFRNLLRLNGLRQAKLFSWDETAIQAISAWEKSYVESHSNSQNKLISWAQLSANLAEIYQRLTKQISSNFENNCGQTYDEIRRLAACIEQNETQVAAIARISRTNELPDKILWRIEGPFDSSYSLALVNREIARALSGLGHRIVLHSTEGPGDISPNEEFLAENPDLAKMHRRSTLVSQAQSDVTSRNLYPPRVEDIDCRLCLLHAYGWEESGFPAPWADSFNLYLQGITVMSEHVRKLLIDNGITVPITTCGIGVDHWERIKADVSIEIKGRSFRFLHVSSCFPRKGVDALLHAYGKAFSIRDDVSLVIKTFQNPHNQVHLWLSEASAGNPDYPDVVILEEDYTDAQLKGIYQQCHALVAPSRCEGFGLPMAEAMLSGLPVITTGWSGQLDFCTHETSWLIDFSFQPAATHFNLFSSVWAEPNISHMTELMREIFHATEQEKLKRISAGRRLLQERFSWTHVAERLVSAARERSQFKQHVKPRIGWVTTWNTRCGIADYSEHLLRHLPDTIKVFAPHTNQPARQDNENVCRCWNLGDGDSLECLTRAIDDAGVNALVLQFNYGLFNLTELNNMLVRFIDSGVIVILMLHSTKDPLHAPQKRLVDLLPALSRCHRVLVHSPNDLNNLMTYGLMRNVAIFPHGILDFKPDVRVSDNILESFVIASYGFFLPHKGLFELIEAISILRDQGEPVNLRMFNAEYPIIESAVLIKQAKDLVAQRGLNNCVEIITDYLDENDGLAGLSEVDLIVFPYQESGESSSAAVRHGIASGSAVAVTPLPIFDDVKGAVHQLPGMNAHQLASGILELRHKMASSDPLIADQVECSILWRNQHYFSILAPRLLNIISALINESR